MQAKFLYIYIFILLCLSCWAGVVLGRSTWTNLRIRYNNASNTPWCMLSNPSHRCDESLRCVLHAFNTSRRTDISILFHFISFFFSFFFFSRWLLFAKHTNNAESCFTFIETGVQSRARTPLRRWMRQWTAMHCSRSVYIQTIGSNKSQRIHDGRMHLYMWLTEYRTVPMFAERKHRRRFLRKIRCKLKWHCGPFLTRNTLAHTPRRRTNEKRRKSNSGNAASKWKHTAADKRKKNNNIQVYYRSVDTVAAFERKIFTKKSWAKYFAIVIFILEKCK